MLCTNCKKEQATFFYTQTINGKESSAALCPRCAKNAGLGTADILSPLFHPFSANHTPKRDTAKTCSLCGLTFTDIARLGKVGCPDCYKTFREELGDTIRSIHGTAKHVGFSPERAVNESVADTHVQTEEEKLRAELTAAIQAENYEEAAKLRDAIKALKGEN